MLIGKALDTEEKKKKYMLHSLSNIARCTGAAGSSPTIMELTVRRTLPNLSKPEGFELVEEMLTSNNQLVFKADDNLGNVI